MSQQVLSNVHHACRLNLGQDHAKPLPCCMCRTFRSLRMLCHKACAERFTAEPTVLGSLAKSLLVWVPHATLRQLSGSLLLCRNISVAGLGVKSACCPHCCKQSQLPFVVVSTCRQEHVCKLKTDNLFHISKATHAWHSDLQASWACAATLVLSGCVSDLETGAAFC